MLGKALIVGGSGYLGYKIAKVLQKLYNIDLENLDPVPCTDSEFNSIYSNYYRTKAQDYRAIPFHNFNKIICIGGASSYEDANNPIAGTDVEILNAADNLKILSRLENSDIIYFSSVASNNDLSNSYSKLKADGLQTALERGYSIIQLPNVLGGSHRKNNIPKKNLPYYIAQAKANNLVFELHSNCVRNYITAQTVAICLNKVLNTKKASQIELSGTNFKLSVLTKVLAELDIKYIEEPNLTTPLSLSNLNKKLKLVKTPTFNVVDELIAEVINVLEIHF